MMISVHTTHKYPITRQEHYRCFERKVKAKVVASRVSNVSKLTCQLVPVLVPGESTSRSISRRRWRRSHDSSPSHASRAICRGPPAVRRVWMFTCWQQIIIGDNVLTQSRES